MAEAVMEAKAVSVASPQVTRQQMPLTFLQAGEEARVLKVRGSGEIHHHLENLGFVSGAAVRLVSRLGGNVIVEVKGAQVGLDASAASKVITG